ncbi:MAG: ribosome biogenesis GTPase Der, partial [Desulfobacterales bacterium]
MKPIVAIVGRPNVGKSTFFNRVTRTRDALVSNFPGLTRDRHFGEARWDDTEFSLVDTGGFGGADDLAGQISDQVNLAIEDADAIIFLMDGRQGLSPFDRDIVARLRPISKPVFYAVNKIDGPENEIRMADFYGLGIERLFPLSAEHRYGVTDLLDELVRTLATLQAPADVREDGEIVRLAVVGRPNVGKSSLINSILGQERLLVSSVPGTTRDAIDTLHRVGQQSYLLIDTAGIRRKGKVSLKYEKFSIIKSLRSLDRCDVALAIVDAAEGITEQDVTIAGYAHDRGCGCIFLLNKWDLVDKDGSTLRRFSQILREQAKFLGFAPVLSVSALTGQRVPKIFTLVDEVYRQYSTRIGTGRLNKAFEAAIEQNTPSLH